MEKTTRKLNDLLSQFLSLRNEVSEIADKTADAHIIGVGNVNFFTTQTGF